MRLMATILTRMTVQAAKNAKAAVLPDRLTTPEAD
jgi:hypothetical protein